MRNMYHHLIIALTCVLLLPISITAQVTTIPVGTTTRSMILYVPPALPLNRPLVISMHGLNQGADYQQAQAKWEPVADTAKFVVVFPSGINRQWDISGNSDIDFISAIIDTMARRYSIDRNRVYLSGFSMGGMMTYHAATRIANKIAAFAPVSGYPLGGANYNSSRPVPVIHVHGTADDVVTYNNVINYLNGWVTRDQCPSTPVITQPYPANKPNSIASKRYWGPGAEGSEVVLITLTGKGHWYSVDTVNGVHTSIEIWNFAKRFSLGNSIQENATGFCGVNGTIDNNYPGYTGSGFANTNNAIGNGINWRINFATAGTKTFTVRYAGIENRPAKLIVNGITVVSNINFPPTGSWSAWSTVAVTANVNAGIFNVRLEATGNNGLPNIDNLEVTGGTAADCGAVITSSNSRVADNPNEAEAKVLSDKSITLYPNPAYNKIKLMLSAYWKAGDNITIYDATGKVLLNKQSTGNMEELNITSLSAGTYFLRVTNKDSEETVQTFIKRQTTP
jgi:poly(hydroxyalkanoate) depolymerase family esterase